MKRLLLILLFGFNCYSADIFGFKNNDLRLETGIEIEGQTSDGYELRMYTNELNADRNVNLGDININFETVVDDQVLKFDSATQTWNPETLSTTSGASNQDYKNLYINGLNGGTFVVTYDTLQVGNSSLTSGNFTVDVDGGNGVLKLDTGAYTNTTWYYIWVICKDSGANPSAFISLSATSPTMPADYTQKRRIGSLRANSASTYMKFNTGGYGIFLYEEQRVILTAGTQTVWTAVDASSLLPPTTTLAYSFMQADDDAGQAYILTRATGTTGSSGASFIVATGATHVTSVASGILPVNTSQSFDYICDAGDIGGYVYIVGYIDNL